MYMISTVRIQVCVLPCALTSVCIMFSLISSTISLNGLSNPKSTISVYTVSLNLFHSFWSLYKFIFDNVQFLLYPKPFYFKYYENKLHVMLNYNYRLLSLMDFSMLYNMSILYGAAISVPPPWANFLSIVLHCCSLFFLLEPFKSNFRPSPYTLYVV